MESLISPRDMHFWLHDWLSIETLLEKPAFNAHSRDTIDAVLDLSDRLAAGMFLTHYKAADAREPWMDGNGVHILPEIKMALDQYADLGLFAAGFSPELGGMGLPFLACSASFAMFAAANIATSAYPMLTVANARLIVAFGSAAQIGAFAKPQIAGRWFGTMCLSEPQAGSSLADIITRVEPDGDDALGARYRLSGNKMWISGGDQDASENIVHLVLAKVPDASGALSEGTEGLSLFIVPKILPDGTRNDIAVAGLNHKMGYRGTANCLLNFGEKIGATGWRIGAPGQGLAQMFLMMNEARISVGLGAAALAYRGHRLSVRYARERLQGRPMGTRHGPPVAIIEHADVKRMLLAQKAYAEGSLALCLYCARLIDEHGDADASALLGLLTPVAKTFPSEYGLAANDLAIQIHGGYGYTRDFDVEQLYRDNRLNAIHEGTTGIQAMDLLGRKILRGDGRGLAVLGARLAETCVRASACPALAGHAEPLREAWAAIVRTIDAVRTAEPAHTLDNATSFLSAFGHVVVSWLWLDMALTAKAARPEGPLEAAYFAGKLRACRYVFECELPKVHVWLAHTASLSNVASGAAEDIF